MCFSIGCNKTAWGKCHLYTDWVSKYALQLSLSWEAAPPPTSLLLRSFPLHCRSSNNRGKQTLWPSGSKIIKVTFPKGKILLTFCIHVYIAEVIYINCVIMDLFSHKHVLNYLPPSNTDALGRCGRFPEHFCIFLRSGMRSTADSFVNNPSPLRDFF